jgi:hypothetical protein
MLRRKANHALQAIALRLQATPPAGRVAELGSFEISVIGQPPRIYRVVPVRESGL